MWIYLATISLMIVSTTSRYWKEVPPQNDIGVGKVKRESEETIETTTFFLSPEREEELLVGEGFGTDQEAAVYFANITAKNCRDDDEGVVLFTNCQYSKDCANQANTESECVTDIAKMCKYNEKWEDRRCVNHMMAHITFYRDSGTGAVGPYQKAQGLDRKDIEEEKEEKKQAKKSKKRNNASNRAESAQVGQEEKDPATGLSSLLGSGSKSQPGLLGGSSGKAPSLLGGKSNGVSLLG